MSYEMVLTNIVSIGSTVVSSFQPRFLVLRAQSMEERIAEEMRRRVDARKRWRLAQRRVDAVNASLALDGIACEDLP